MVLDIEHGYRVHWWQLITDLMLLADMSQRDIARAVDPESEGAWVNQLRNGVHASPLFTRGLRLVRLWEVRVADVQGFDLSRVLAKDS